MLLLRRLLLLLLVLLLLLLLLLLPLTPPAAEGDPAEAAGELASDPTLVTAKLALLRACSAEALSAALSSLRLSFAALLAATTFLCVLK